MKSLTNRKIGNKKIWNIVISTEKPTDKETLKNINLDYGIQETPHETFKQLHEKPRSSPQPFISIIEITGIKKDIDLSEKEVKILEKAVLHNNGIVNLLSNTEEIKNLLNKGLLHLSKDGGFVITNRIVDIIFNTCRKVGSFLLCEDDNKYSNNKYKNNGSIGLLEEIKRDNRFNDNVSSISWHLPNIV